MKIRRFKIGEEAALFSVHISAIHEIASKDCSREQIEALALVDRDMDTWVDLIQRIRPFVVELDNEVVCYADLQSDGFIEHFFVSGYQPRRGIGTQLMLHIHQEASARKLRQLTSNVSKAAEPFFILHGFHVVERQHPACRDFSQKNALMRKSLEDGYKSSSSVSASIGL